MVRYGTPRRSRSRGRLRRGFKRLRSRSTRRKGYARPRKSLRTSYKGVPNQYRFVRESLPFTIDVGNPPATYGQLIGGGGVQNLTLLFFSGFQMKQLVEFERDFPPLFNTYKLDKLEVFMLPQWEGMIASPMVETAGTGVSLALPNLACTRVSTRYMLNNPAPVSALDAREQLAQIQMKSRSTYASKRWLKLTTTSPMVMMKVESLVTTAPTNLAPKKAPWLDLLTGADQKFMINSQVYLDRIDGNDFPGGSTPYKYRCYYKAHFRVSRVH